MGSIKAFIKQRLLEAIKHLPYNSSAEDKAMAYPSLSNPSHRLDIDKIKFRIAKAANIANAHKSRFPTDNYFINPSEGQGFYQVEFRHDGQIKTKHIQASGDMEQRGGKFQPSDVGTCKDFQNVAKYCFVKAGTSKGSVGSSPAEDASNKALIIFRNEILDFLTQTSYVDDKAADISKQAMSPKQASHKEKKDLEAKIGRRVSDSEWNAYQASGQEPKAKPQIALSPDKAADFEKRQELAKQKLAAIRARQNR